MERDQYRNIIPGQGISLYRFLNLVDGSWRNAVYIECRTCPYGQPQCGDHLLAIDHDGTPILYPVLHFIMETGELVDKGECAATLSRQQFEVLFRRWLVWNLLRSYDCNTRMLSRP